MKEEEEGVRREPPSRRKLLLRAERTSLLSLSFFLARVCFRRLNEGLVALHAEGQDGRTDGRLTGSIVVVDVCEKDEEKFEPETSESGGKRERDHLFSLLLQTEFERPFRRRKEVEREKEKGGGDSRHKNVEERKKASGNFPDSFC